MNHNLRVFGENPETSQFKIHRCRFTIEWN